MTKIRLENIENDRPITEEQDGAFLSELEKRLREAEESA